MKMHPFNWIFTIILILAAGIWLYTNFGLIHSKHLSEAVVKEKHHHDGSYTITLENDKKLHVKDASTWMLLDTGDHYNITYEWYGMKKPYVKEINQAHDEDQVGGH